MDKGQANSGTNESQTEIESALDDLKKGFRKSFHRPLELIGAFILLIYTVFTGLMYCANRDAANAATIAARAAQSAADTAAKQFEIGNRPWVEANINMAGPFAFENGEARISLNFQLQTVGNSPAFDAFINIHSTFQDPEIPSDSVKDRDDLCKDTTRIITESERIGRGVGITIFPQQQPLPVLPQSVVITKEDIEKRKSAKFLPGKILLPGATVCIGYRSTFDSTLIHHTAYIVHVEKDFGSPIMFDIGQDIPVEHLRVKMLPVQSIYAD